LEDKVSHIMGQLDFHAILIQGMLSFLLFAGALEVDINILRERKWEIATLASFSTITSTLLVGIATFYILHFINYDMPFIYCMLFGSLISPTDPIAVLAIFKGVNAPKKLEMCVAGESLFNDGLGIVIFLTIYEVAFHGVPPTPQAVSFLFLQQAIGGIIYGAALGLFGHWLIKEINDYKVEILITLAMASGGYLLAEIIHVSGPLAMVVAGIFMGNRGDKFSVSKSTQQHLDNFWELVDEILNAVLFLMIGLELFIVKLSTIEVMAGLLAIPMVLLIRFVTVALPLSLFKLKKNLCPPLY